MIDTTGLNVHQLKERVVAAFSEAGSTQMQVAVESFGFKHGLPLDADIVMDVRFLPNPHWDGALRPADRPRPGRARLRARAGRDVGVPRSPRRPAAHRCCRRTRPRAAATSPIAIGCTGGRHRSVAIAEELADRLRARGLAVRTTHRDVAR